MASPPLRPAPQSDVAVARGTLDCLIEMGRQEQKEAESRHLHRDKEKEDYYQWSGNRGVSSTGLLTILNCSEQRNVVMLATAFYVFALCAYTLLANSLVYATFHWVPNYSPSWSGNYSNPHNLNGTHELLRYADPGDLHYRRELYDIGFQFTPNRSDRPWWLKAAFVDTMVMISQFVAPAVLLWFGQTQNYVCYVSLIGFQGILKGITQLLTILPSANKGQYCWLVNFGEQNLDVVLHGSFSSWFYKGWGTSHGCDDMLWSGHTSQSCIGILFVNNTLRTQNVPRWIRMFLGIYFCIYVVAVLSCRMHYSIDVFVAAIIASLMYTHSQLRYWIWWVANSIVRNPKKKSDHDPLPTHSEVASEAEEAHTSSAKGLLCCSMGTKS